MPERPDYDGELTKDEADKWWLGRSENPLYVDQGKINLPGVDIQSFNNQNGTSFYENFIWNLRGGTGPVYGTLKLTLLNAKNWCHKIGGSKFMDLYDFKLDGRILRNFAAWAGRPNAGDLFQELIFTF